MASTEPDFAPINERLPNDESNPAGAVLEGDAVMHRGTGEGWAKDADF